MSETGFKQYRINLQEGVRKQLELSSWALTSLAEKQSKALLESQF